MTATRTRPTLVISATLLVFVLSGGLATHAAHTSPGTINVDDDCTDPGDGTVGDPFCTIQEAVDHASAGDTISVAAGTYQEQVVVDESVTLSGAGSGSTVIEAPASPATESDGDGTSIVEFTGATTSTFSGFTVQGDLGGMTAALHVHDGATVSITDNVVDGTDALSGTLTGGGIAVGDTLDGDEDAPGSATISDNTVTDFHRAGIAVIGDGAEADISGNTVTGGGPTGLSTQQGITIQDAATGSISDNHVTAVSFTGAAPQTAVGIFLWDAGDGIDVRDNTVKESQTGIMVQATVDLVISGNTVRKPEGSAGMWFLGRGATGTGCAGGDGATPGLGCAVEAEVTDNILTGFGEGTGILVGKTPELSFTPAPATLTIRRNHIAAWGTGVWVGPASPDNDVTLTRNAIVGNAAGVDNTMTASVAAARDWWGRASGPSGEGPGTGDSISTDVTFVPWCRDLACSSFVDLAGVITGSNGDDRIFGTAGDDLIYALDGDDVVNGLGGNDVVYGGPGDDILKGGLGNDDLFGNAGRDLLKGGPGNNACAGGPGQDILVSC